MIVSGSLSIIGHSARQIVAIYSPLLITDKSRTFCGFWS